MPTKQIVDANLNSGSQIYNSVRNSLGGTFKDVMPAVDMGQDINSQLREIGRLFDTFTVQQNDFLSALVNRIARVIVTSKLYQNPWEMFKKGLLEYGETVEEIFVNLLTPHDFNPQVAEAEFAKREIPDVRSAFHTMNYQKFYKVTVSNDQLRQAFLSDSGIVDLVGRIIEELYTSANYDELVTMKYMLAKLTLDGYVYPMQIPEVTADNANAIVTKIKALSNNLTFMNTSYNSAKVSTYTNKTDQINIMSSAFEATIGVNSMAKAYNLDYVKFSGQSVLIDSFAPNADETKRLHELFGAFAWYTPFTESELTELNTISSYIVDRDYPMIFDNFYNMTQFYNPDGLYWNYDYHVWKTFSASPFNNAIVLTSQPIAVTSVTVSPDPVTIAKGQSAQLNATVATTGFAPKTVIWTLTGTETVTSTIDASGKVTISPTEANTSLTATATSTYDSTKSDVSTITVA